MDRVRSGYAYFQKSLRTELTVDMRRFASKLGFIHRTLWQRDQTYRWAVLLGPSPLIGAALAALAVSMVQSFAPHTPGSVAGSDAPWAHWKRPVVQEGQPFTETPRALPASNTSGGFLGFQPGWVGAIQPLSVDATMDVNLIATVRGRFKLDQPTVPLDRIVDAAPPTGLFAGTGKSFYVVRTAGLYAFSARLTRSGTQSADCLVRLASGHHQILRNVVLNSAGTAVLKFTPVEFRLEPGLFLIQVGVGCWRGDRLVGDGELALMVRHPGEADLAPATAAELIRPTQQGPGEER